MRIVVTDCGFVWNHENPALKPFKDIVLVVCLNGKKVTDEYECFVTDYKSVGLGGIGSFGAESRLYQALEKAGEKLNRSLRYHDRIVFLADNEPETLYPYRVLSRLNAWNSLHLCAMPPWKFEGRRRMEAYHSLLGDLLAVQSLLYIDSASMLAELKPDATYLDLLRKASDYCGSLLPRILYGVQEMAQGRHYFDFGSMAYVPVREGFNGIDLSLKSQEIDPSKIKAYRHSATLEILLFNEYPNQDTDTKQWVEAPVPRPDGKKICRFLRQKRLDLAAANRIDFSSDACPSVGSCGGTCPKCDEEARYLREALERIPEAQRVYPHFSTEEMG